MDPRVVSNVKIKREVDSSTVNCCDEDRDEHRDDHPDHDTGGNPYSGGSSILCEDGRGQGTQENHLTHPLKVQYTQGLATHREQLGCSQYSVIRVPSDISQGTTELPDTTHSIRRRKRSLPSRFQNEYLDHTEAKRASITSYSSGLHHRLVSSPRPLTSTYQEQQYSHTHAANEVNTCPPTSFQQIPIIGEAFHVDTFTPGPLDQVIVCKPEESYSMRPGNQFHPEPKFECFDKQAATRIYLAGSSGGGSRSELKTNGSASDGVNDSGSSNSIDGSLMATGGSGESWKSDEIEEERQWSQVQWYRDLKKQNATYSRGNNRTEPTIVMRCNELKERRNREGRNKSKHQRAWEVATPMNKHCGKSSDGSASADRDYHARSEHYSPSPRNVEGMRNGGRYHAEMNGFCEHAYQERTIPSPVTSGPRHNTETRNASNKQPDHCYCCSEQSWEVLKERYITQENHVKSRCQKEDKSKGEQDSSSTAKHSKEFSEDSQTSALEARSRNKAKEFQYGKPTKHSKELSEDEHKASLESKHRNKAKESFQDGQPTKHSNELSEDSQRASLESRHRDKAKEFQDIRSLEDKDQVVCQVNGLFSLPGIKDTKYNITLDELHRRIGLPESLTRVEMISYVRQAKSSGRTLLDRYQVFASNRSKPTILSRVCEGEARVLADGIHEMNERYLPMHSMAAKTVREFKKRECHGNQDCGFKLRRRVVDMEVTRNVLKEMQNVLEETQLQEFELASHNFGLMNLRNHLNLLDKYFDTLMQRLQDTVDAT